MTAAFKLQQFDALRKFVQCQGQGFPEFFTIFPSLINFYLQEEIVQILF